LRRHSAIPAVLSTGKAVENTAKSRICDFCRGRAGWYLAATRDINNLLNVGPPIVGSSASGNVTFPATYARTTRPSSSTSP